jgi:hypothetical protein
MQVRDSDELSDKQAINFTKIGSILIIEMIQKKELNYFNFDNNENVIKFNLWYELLIRRGIVPETICSTPKEMTYKRLKIVSDLPLHLTENGELI